MDLVGHSLPLVLSKELTKFQQEPLLHSQSSSKFLATQTAMDAVADGHTKPLTSGLPMPPSLKMLIHTLQALVILEPANRHPLLLLTSKLWDTLASCLTWLTR